jgi:chromosome segregation ATPase
MPAIIRAYQQKLTDLMAQLQRYGMDILKLRQRHAEDCKKLIMMEREVQRIRSELKMEQLKYQSVKAENEILTAAIAAREELIRNLRREIARLRALLQMQEPLKDHLRGFEEEKNKTEIALVETRRRVEHIEKDRRRFADAPPAAAYFDGMLRRHQERLARLQQKRKEMKEAEERARVETLRACSYIVRMGELSVPEDTIFKIMPRPAPVLRLQQVREQIKAREREQPVPTTRESPKKGTLKPGSYAEALSAIGELAGKKSPRTLQALLRDARHNRIAVPVLPSAGNPRSPSVLSIKPIKR